MQRICVYCGSNPGSGAGYAAAARELADVLVESDLELVYGGARKGLMGVVADAVLERGGKVHGVIPKMLVDKEVAHDGLTKLHVVASMHDRKAMMAACWRSSITRERRVSCAGKTGRCCCAMHLRPDCCGSSRRTRCRGSRSGPAKRKSGVTCRWPATADFVRATSNECQSACP